MRLLDRARYFFRAEEEVDDDEGIVPILAVEEDLRFPAIGPFNQIEGMIKRSEILLPNRRGDAIWTNGRAICVIDASAPYEQLQGLSETDMVRDLQNLLSGVFDDTPLTPDRLLDAFNTALTSSGRDQWRGQEVEFGLSVGGVYYCSSTSHVVTCFGIGTNTLCVNGQIAIPARKEFYNPFPMPGSRVVKKMPPMVKTFPTEEVMSVMLCTDGVNPTQLLQHLDRPMEECIVPGAKEATVLRIER